MRAASSSCDRRGLLEVFQQVGILRDVAAIDAMSFRRHFFHRLFPARLILWLSARARERFQACGNHQFQVPFREHRIGVLPIENFSLLGDADTPGKTSFRLGQDCRMRRPASAPDRTAATVKQSQFHSAFSRHAVQITMRLVQFPCAGQHSSIFIGVGVAQHHFLPSSPGIEQRFIIRMPPQAPHRAARRAQRIDRLKQRHRHQAGVVIAGNMIARVMIAGTSQTHAASLRQADQVEHIVLRLRPADDVLTDRLCGINLLEPLDRSESLD